MSVGRKILQVDNPSKIDETNFCAEPQTWNLAAVKTIQCPWLFAVVHCLDVHTFDEKGLLQALSAAKRYRYQWVSFEKMKASMEFVDVPRNALACILSFPHNLTFYKFEKVRWHQMPKWGNFYFCFCVASSVIFVIQFQIMFFTFCVFDGCPEQPAQSKNDNLLKTSGALASNGSFYLLLHIFDGACASLIYMLPFLSSLQFCFSRFVFLIVD